MNNAELIQMFFNIVGTFGFFLGAFAVLFKKKITVADIVKQINDLQLKK